VLSRSERETSFDERYKKEKQVISQENKKKNKKENKQSRIPPCLPSVL